MPRRESTSFLLFPSLARSSPSRELKPFEKLCALRVRYTLDRVKVAPSDPEYVTPGVHFIVGCRVYNTGSVDDYCANCGKSNMRCNAVIIMSPNQVAYPSDWAKCTGWYRYVVCHAAPNSHQFWA